MRPHLLSSFPTMRLITPALMSAWLAFAPTGSQGGVLQEIYTGMMQNDPVFAQGDYLTRAAMENVAMQQRRYLPSLTASAREAWVYQDIRDSGNQVFPEGTADFDSTRIKVELDQPILDFTIKPQIEASRAKLRQVQSRNDLSDGWKTRDVIMDFLKVARFKELMASTDRVISRLESEKDAISRSSEANVATVNEVQSVKLSLAATKRDRNNYAQQMNIALAGLGVSADRVRNVTMQRNSLPGTESGKNVVTMSTDAQTPEIHALQAEADAYGHLASAARRRTLPTVSFYGSYGHFRDGGSVFGGALDQDIYEIGVVVKWDIFGRGMNYSEAREYEFLRLAKEAELQARQNKVTLANSADSDLLAQSRQSVSELADLVEQHRILRDSAARAYEAGQDSYVNSINAMLAYEATVRELINTKHDLLMRQVYFEAQTGGWNQDLVSKVDSMFVASN